MQEIVKPRLDALPVPQQTLWPELREIPSCFVLYGGTALTLRFGHRESVDFDFFSNRPLNPEKLYESLACLKDGQVQQMSANTLTCTVDRGGPVQLSFFGGLDLGCVHEPGRCPDNDLQVASVLDIGAAKVRVVIARPAWKDYVDIDAILQHGVSLSKMLSAARALYKPPYSPMLSLKALSFFDDIGPEFPKEGRERLLSAVAEVKLDRLITLPVRKDLQQERGLSL